MKNVVVITSDYMPNPDANGICAYNIMNEMKKEDNIICICNKKSGEKERELIEGVHVIRVDIPKHMAAHSAYKKNPSCINRIRKYWHFGKRMVKNVLYIKKYPQIEFKREKEILRILEEQKKIDLIIAIFRPYDGIGAALKYKEKHSEVIVCGYFLDSLAGATPRGISAQRYKRLLRRNELSIIEKLDIVLKPMGDKAFYQQQKEIYNKIEFVDFPVLVKAETNIDFSFNKDEISLVFVGTLSSRYRSPEYLLEVLKKVYIENPRVRFHFWGHYDKLEQLKIWEEEYKNIFEYHGTVSYMQSRAIIKNADVLINITNKDMNMIPSKVFEIIAQCKPIINISSNDNDECEKIFETYPAVCSLNAVNKDLSKDVSALNLFIDKAIEENIDYSQIIKTYYTSSPCYIYEKIKRKYEEVISNVEK